jgi:hypothetical protein
MTLTPPPANLFTRIAHGYVRRRYAILFYSLLLTIAAGPLVGSMELDTGFIELLLAANLLAAVLPIVDRPSRRLLLIIPAAVCAVRIAGLWPAYPQLAVAGLLMWTFVALGAAALAVRYAIRTQVADGEHLYAGLDAYLLFGVFCGVLYWCFDQLHPAALVVAGQNAETSLPLTDSIYFSFVTLVTLGYGDILPLSNAARGLAVVEAVTGQLYLTVMVAYLVSLFVRRPSEE